MEFKVDDIKIYKHDDIYLIPLYILNDRHHLFKQKDNKRYINDYNIRDVHDIITAKNTRVVDNKLTIYNMSYIIKYVFGDQSE